MINDIKVVFLDLFFTLITPRYNVLRNENDVLGITQDEWEKYAEDYELYEIRATGKELIPEKIIESILEKMKICVTDSEKKEILSLRKERFKNALMDVDLKILDALLDLKKKGKKICLISNADIIDVMDWDKSPLYNLFDDAIFSYTTGYIKPQKEIYEIALKRMKVKPEECIFIGDGGSDELQGARHAGIKTVLTGYLLKRDAKQLNILKEYADFYINDFDELKILL